MSAEPFDAALNAVAGWVEPPVLPDQVAEELPMPRYSNESWPSNEWKVTTRYKPDTALSSQDPLPWSWNLYRKRRFGWKKVASAWATTEERAIRAADVCARGMRAAAQRQEERTYYL